jgi:hypothetical protein
VGTLWTTAVNAGDAFALVDANLNPTGAWYEVESVVSNTEITLKQSYAGTTGSNKQYCVFNLVGNMTTPSFAQRLATFFASFQSLIDKPTTTPTASSIPIADSGGKIADGWIPATVARLASPTLTGTPAAPTAPKATNTTQIATTAHVKDVLADYVAKTQVATTSTTGVVELATTAETSEGQDATRAVTPAGLEYHPSILISDRIYEGVDLTTKFAAEIAGYTDVWAWLKARKDAVNYSGLHIGDYVPFTLGAETIHSQIAGIDTYYRTTDSDLGHHIDFISRDCMATLRQWNTTNVNNGSADNPSPYMVSALKATLDGLVSSLPAGLQSVIKTKRFLLESRYSSGSTLTDSTSFAWNDMGKLWVPTKYEVFGNIVMGTKPYAAMQGVQYPIFANSYKSRIKRKGHQGPRCHWWLATVFSGYSTSACYVNNSGHPNATGASASYGVPLCFRIA